MTTREQAKPSDMFNLVQGVVALALLGGGICQAFLAMEPKALAVMLAALAASAILATWIFLRIRGERNKYSTLYHRLRRDLEGLADQLQMHAEGNCIHMNVPSGPALLPEEAHLPEILAYTHERQRRQTAGASNDSYEDFSKPPDF